MVFRFPKQFHFKYLFQLLRKLKCLLDFLPKRLLLKLIFYINAGQIRPYFNKGRLERKGSCLCRYKLNNLEALWNDFHDDILYT